METVVNKPWLGLGGRGFHFNERFSIKPLNFGNFELLCTSGFQIRPNFIVRFIITFLVFGSCPSDICPCNICTG